MFFIAGINFSPIFAAVIFVTRAIVVKNGYVLAAQRPATMSLPFKWELPGGKMEPGEDPIDCLYREAIEEFDLEILVIEDLDHEDNFFKEKVYRMLPFVAVVTGGNLHVHEHAQAVWQPLDELFELDWAPAEQRILRSWLSRTAAHAPAVQAALEAI